MDQQPISGWGEERGQWVLNAPAATETRKSTSLMSHWSLM